MPPESLPASRPVKRSEIGEGQQLVERRPRARPRARRAGRRRGRGSPARSGPRTGRSAAACSRWRPGSRPRFVARVEASTLERARVGSSSPAISRISVRLAGPVRADEAGDLAAPIVGPDIAVERRDVVRRRSGLVTLGQHARTSTICRSRAMAAPFADRFASVGRASPCSRDSRTVTGMPCRSAAVGVVDDDPQAVDEVGPQLGRLDRLGRELGGRRDEADPAAVGLVRRVSVVTSTTMPGWMRPEIAARRRRCAPRRRRSARRRRRYRSATRSHPAPAHGTERCRRMGRAARRRSATSGWRRDWPRRSGGWRGRSRCLPGGCPPPAASAPSAAGLALARAMSRLAVA